MLILKKLYYNKYSKRSHSLSNVDVVIDHIFKNLSKSMKLKYNSILGQAKKTVSSQEKDVEISLHELKKKI